MSYDPASLLLLLELRMQPTILACGSGAAPFLSPVIPLFFFLVHTFGSYHSGDTILRRAIQQANMADGTPPGYMDDEKMAGDDAGSHEDAVDTGEDIYQSLDPLDPRKVSLDIFEMYCHEMVNTPTIGRRAYLIIQMRVSYFLISFS